MRLISILVSVIVAFSLYFLIVDRKSLVDFIKNFQKEKEILSELDNNSKSIKNSIKENELPIVLVKKSKEIISDNKLILRGSTEAIRKVEVRAEVNGGVISEPRLKGSRIKKNEGYSNKPYKDQLGFYTIGYGHLIRPYVKKYFKIKYKKKHFDELFEADFKKSLKALNIFPPCG